MYTSRYQAKRWASEQRARQAARWRWFMGWMSWMLAFVGGMLLGVGTFNELQAWAVGGVIVVLCSALFAVMGIMDSGMPHARP